MKHTIHARQCSICGKGLGCRTRKATTICLTCMSDRGNLPEEHFCKGITSKGKRCRTIANGYCNHHKNQGEEK